MTLDVPQWVWDRVDAAIDRLLERQEKAPRLPLSADGWEFEIGDDVKLPPDVNGGWLLVSVQAIESSMTWQRGLMVVWARRRK